MISHIIAYVLAILGTIIIYLFTGEVYILGLAGLLLALFVIEVICNIILVKSMKVSVKMKDSSMANKNIRIMVSLTNRSHIPVIRGEIKVKVRNRGFDITETYKKTFSMKNGRREIIYELSSAYCGRYDVTVEYIRIYDFLSITYGNILKNERKQVYLFPVCGYVGSVSEVQRTNYEKERYFNHKKNTVLSEILQYREYQPGDNLRHINWKLSDRLGEILVREFDTPTDNQVLLTYDADNINKKTKSIVYSAIMAVSATYIRKNLFHQVGWYRNSDGRIVLRDMYKFEDLYNVMKLLFDEEMDDQPMEILYFARSGMLKKYAKVIYITNHMSERLKKELSIYENIQVVEIDERVFNLENAEDSIKKIAV